MTRRITIPQGRLVGLSLSRKAVTITLMEGSLAGRSYTMTLALPSDSEPVLEHLRDTCREVASLAADMLLDLEDDLAQGALIPLPGAEG